MSRQIASMAEVSVDFLFSVTTWAQVGTPGAARAGDGADPVTPSGAATVRTPGTPGAADTPGALLRSPSNNSPVVSSSPTPKIKKPANKSSESSAPPAN
jgi:hypothetical protein